MRARISLALMIAAAACGQGLPADIQAAVDAHLPEARLLAEAAGARCAELKTTRNLPSPAAGTALDRSPQLLQVDISCVWPNWLDERRFQPLREGPYDPLREGGSWWILSSKELHRERVHLPAQGEASFALSVQRPIADGGYVEVVVGLRR